MKNTLFLYTALASFLFIACSETIKESESLDNLNPISNSNSLNPISDSDSKFHTAFGSSPGDYAFRQVVAHKSITDIYLIHKVVIHTKNPDRSVTIVHNPPRESAATDAPRDDRQYFTFASCAKGQLDITVDSVDFEYDILDSNRNVISLNKKDTIRGYSLRCHEVGTGYSSGFLPLSVN